MAEFGGIAKIKGLWFLLCFSEYIVSRVVIRFCGKLYGFWKVKSGWLIYFVAKERTMKLEEILVTEDKMSGRESRCEKNKQVITSN